MGLWQTGTVIAVPSSPAHSAPQPRFTEPEYLALEAVAEIRHEYIGGDIIGMAGAELDHNQIAQNIKLALGMALRERPCRILGSDQRVKVETTGEYFYPDILVTCLKPQLVGPSPRSLVNPQVLIEVLSPSTEHHDRGAKWLAYQTIPSLTDDLLVANDRRRVEHYQRSPDGSWRFQVHHEGTWGLASGIEVSMDATYHLTELSNPKLG